MRGSRISTRWLLIVTTLALSCSVLWPGLSGTTRAGTLLLPVFTMSAPQVTAGQNGVLAQQFDAIASGPSTPQTDTSQYNGRSRFITPNGALTSFLERYSATGGFYAYNPSLAFSETPTGVIDETTAAQRACGFLFRGPNSPAQNFIGADGQLLVGHDSGQGTVDQPTVARTVAPGDCSQPTGYRTTLIYSSVENAGSTTPATPQVIGALVQVPLFVPYTNPIDFSGSIALGGAGGHMSFLVRGGDRFQSLDSGSPGISAVSMPFYSRQTAQLQRGGTDASFAPLDYNQVRSQIDQGVRAAFPGASDVSVPNPTIFYDVSDAGTPQTIMEPKYNFSGIQVTVDGHVITLKDVNVPALAGGAGGLGPTVTINSPASNASFTPGAAVNFTGTIADGVGPYTYSWTLDDGTQLGSGTLAVAGQVTVQSSNLPAVSHGGTPAPVTVYLNVTDDEGVQRSAAVVVRPSVAPTLFLPLVPRGASSQIVIPASVLDAARTSGSGIYDFGIEANSDYPPFGVSQSGDLPGVVPDANGFSLGMQLYGWGRKFNWWNASAWERDWRDCGLGGSDCSYGVDRTDFAYYSGHGGAGGLALATNINSTWFDGSNARFSTLRWAAFSSCQTLRAQWTPANQAPIRRWFNAFQGAHMLLGFNSNMGDIAFGLPLAERMKPITFFGITLYQMSIRDAWVLTAFNLNAGKPAYIYAVGTNGVNPVDNKLPRPGDGALPRPFPAASYHWVWWNE
jgi:hypothetical protein